MIGKHNYHQANQRHSQKAKGSCRALSSTFPVKVGDLAYLASTLTSRKLGTVTSWLQPWRVVFRQEIQAFVTMCHLVQSWTIWISQCITNQPPVEGLSISATCDVDEPLPPFQPPPPARPDSISEWQIPFQTDNPQAFTEDASYTLPCAPSQTSLVLLITPVPAASIMDKNLKTVVHLWLFKHVQNKDLHEMHSTCGTRCIVHVACTSPHPILGDEGGTCNRLLKYRTAVGCNGQIIDNYWSCMTVPRNFVHDCRSQHICRPLKYLEDYIEEQFV